MIKQQVSCYDLFYKYYIDYSKYFDWLNYIIIQKFMNLCTNSNLSDHHMINFYFHIILKTAVILGIKEKSILFKLQSIKFSRSFSIDIMHLFFKNITSHMFKL